MHMTGGVNLAGTPERWEMAEGGERAMFETMGHGNARW